MEKNQSKTNDLSLFLARFETIMQRSVNLIEKNNNKLFSLFCFYFISEKKKKIVLLPLPKFQASGPCFLFNLPGERE